MLMLTQTCIWIDATELDEVHIYSELSDLNYNQSNTVTTLAGCYRF